MTRADIRQLVRNLTGRPADYPRLTDPQIDSHLREGMLRFAQETLSPALLTILDVAVSTGIAGYYVAGTPLRIISVALGDVLEPTTLQRLYVDNPAWQSAANGVCKKWFQQGKSSGNTGFTLYPPPSSPGTAKVLVLAMPASLPSSGDIEEWDEYEQAALAYYAAWRHFQNKTEVDQGEFGSKMMQNYADIENRYRRINSVDSFNSQAAVVEALARAPLAPPPQQGGQ